MARNPNSPQPMPHLAGVYMRTLFDRGEYVCAGDSLYDTKVVSMQELQLPQQFVSVNPLIKGTTRADSNVAVFRNFLVEIDGMSIEEQAEYIEEELQMPFTTKVFSGGKSIHYIISLAQPLANLEQYRKVAQWIMDIVTRADAKCKNPSRFTRMAGAVRTDTGNLQDLGTALRRVEADELTRFFERHQKALAEAEWNRKKILEQAAATIVSPDELPEDFRGELTLRTKTFLQDGAPSGQRNSELYWAACDYKNNCYSYEEAVEALASIWSEMGKDPKELRITVRSAFQKAPLRPRVR